MTRLSLSSLLVVGRSCLFLLAMASAIAVTAACGGGAASPSTQPTSSSGQSSGTQVIPTATLPPAGPNTAAEGHGDLKMTFSRDLGIYILSDNFGRTLYMYTEDGPNVSNCTGDCAQTWLPYITAKTELAGEVGVIHDLIGTTTRDDGSTQVTYNGHPLYRFATERDIRGIRGHGVGGVWFALNALGDPIGQ
ncbi:MAG: hypothetical protein FJ317_08095 [SAR202 cluster bacterium]|nr:hypothetical protein [SAR202 cluster bacterium]